MITFLATHTDLVLAVLPLLVDAESVRQAVGGCRTRAAAQRVTKLLAEAKGPILPDWFVFDPPAPGDVVAVLGDGDVLAWSEVQPGEPPELIAWMDTHSGSVVWREPLA
ncbi:MULTISPECIES: hypothetical protein [Methylobacteriaceae]|uniref:hypothetical protein n=1 Tax=Methylobacteriaceae TaxID=119045 RepID=UPI00116FFCAD|nr:MULTISPECIES: hypothetical protein [Methylobacteriaceae]GEL42922.1 hypothetical protein MEX01_35130 [Methylorubrum extorquens]